MSAARPDAGVATRRSWRVVDRLVAEREPHTQADWERIASLVLSGEVVLPKPTPRQLRVAADGFTNDSVPPSKRSEACRFGPRDLRLARTSPYAVRAGHVRLLGRGRVGEWC